MVSNGAVPVGFDAIEIARIEAGLLFFGRDMTGFETPTELGLDFQLMVRKNIFVEKLRGRKIPNAKAQDCWLDH